MLERGDYEKGSIGEIVAIFAKQKMNRIRRMETMLFVKSCLTVANAVINPEETKFDDINKSLQNYSELLFPELIEEREEAARKVKQLISHERDTILRITPKATAKSRTKLIRRG